MYYRTQGLGELSISFDSVKKDSNTQYRHRGAPSLLIVVMFTGLRSSCHKGK